MAHSHSTIQPESFRFTLPRPFQRFELFKKLPYDIRHMIWEAVIFVPGIHFLKFVEFIGTLALYTSSLGANMGVNLEVISDGHHTGERPTQNVVYSAILKPIFGLECANNSHYIALKKILSQIAESCNEGKHLADRVLAQAGNLRLYDGQLILLERSSDIVCIDYPDMRHTQCLGPWAEHLDLDQLAKIRRLAVRYHHEWDNNLVCAHCGRVHSYLDKHPYPRHVYEFAALFKNLEAFYFIDYLTLRTPSSSGVGSRQPRTQFTSGECGRIYFEVDPQSCTTHTRVHETLFWLRMSYIDHCESNARGPPNPEKVSFGVLGCEWDSEQKLSLVQCRGSQAMLPKKKQPKNHTSSRNSSVIFPPPLTQSTNQSSLPIVFGDAGRSEFDFSPGGSD